MGQTLRTMATYKAGNLKIVLREVKESWGITYQTKLYEGRELVDMNEYIEDQSEAWRAMHGFMMVIEEERNVEFKRA